MIMSQLPVRNCTLFLNPSEASAVVSADVPGVVGVLTKSPDGQYSIVDVFEVESIPGADQLARHARRSVWSQFVNSFDNLRFDVFPMPFSSSSRRHEIVDFVRRTCVVYPNQTQMTLNKAA